MVIVLNPMISNQQINSDSNYIFLQQLLPKMIELRPDWLFIMFWPTGTHFKYYDDGFFAKNRENIIRIPKRFQPGKYRAGADYDIDFYYEFFARTPHNIIWNNAPETTPVFYNLTVQQSPNFAPIVVNYHHFPAHKTLPGFTKENYEGFQSLQAIGTALADVNVFNSKHCINMQMEVCASFLSQNRLNKINSNMKLSYRGPIDENHPVTPFYKDPVFIYNHRIAGYKNWETTFGLFDKLYEKHKFKVFVTTVDTQSVQRVSTKPYAQVFNCYTRDQYLKILQQANINVSNSQHETFCISMVESMAAGHACLANNRVTFPELFNNGEYGQLFSNEEEQYLLMEELIISQEARQKWGQKALIAKTLFSTQKEGEEAVKIFEDQYSTIRMPESEKLDIMEKSIKKIKTMEFMSAYRQVQSDLGWMNQAYPIRYFTFACQHFGRKFKIQNQKVYLI